MPFIQSPGITVQGWYPFGGRGRGGKRPRRRVLFGLVCKRTGGRRSQCAPVAWHAEADGGQPPRPADAGPRTGRRHLCGANYRLIFSHAGAFAAPTGGFFMIKIHDWAGRCVFIIRKILIEFGLEVFVRGTGQISVMTALTPAYCQK